MKGHPNVSEKIDNYNIQGDLPLENSPQHSNLPLDHKDKTLL